MIRVVIIMILGLATYCLLVKYNKLKEKYDDLLVDIQLREDEWRKISVEIGEIAPFEDSDRAVLKRKLEKMSEGTYYINKEDEKKRSLPNYEHICLLEREFGRINQKTSGNY